MHFSVITGPNFQINWHGNLVWPATTTYTTSPYASPADGSGIHHTIDQNEAAVRARIAGARTGSVRS